MKNIRIILVVLLTALLLWCAGAYGAQAEGTKATKAYTVGERVTLEGRVTYYSTKPAMAVIKLFRPVQLTGIPSPVGPLEINQCVEIQLDGSATSLKKLHKTNVRISGVLDGRSTPKDRRDVVLRNIKIEKKMDNVKSVKITGKVKSLAVDATWQLGAQVVPRSAPSQVTWVSVNPRVATVDENGVVTTHERGETEIMLYGANGKESGYLLKVLGPASEMWFGFPSLKMQVGGTNKQDIVYFPEYSFEEKVTWSSEDTSIATVAQDGTVTGKKRGFTFVHAVAESGTALRVHVTVYNKGEKNSSNVIRGGNFSNKDFTWTVDGKQFTIHETSQAQIMAMFPGGTLRNQDAIYDTKTKTWHYYAYYDLPGMYFTFMDSVLIRFEGGSSRVYNEPPYAGTIVSNKGTKIGDTWEQVRQAYGMPSSWSEALKGWIHVDYTYMMKDNPKLIGRIAFAFEEIDGEPILRSTYMVTWDYSEFMQFP